MHQPRHRPVCVCARARIVRVKRSSTSLFRFLTQSRHSTAQLLKLLEQPWKGPACSGLHGMSHRVVLGGHTPPGAAATAVGTLSMLPLTLGRCCPGGTEAAGRVCGLQLAGMLMHAGGGRQRTGLAPRLQQPAAGPPVGSSARVHCPPAPGPARLTAPGGVLRTMPPPAPGPTGMRAPGLRGLRTSPPGNRPHWPGRPREAWSCRSASTTSPHGLAVQRLPLACMVLECSVYH